MAIDYNHELASLLAFIKLDTPESQKVIDVLKTGDKAEIFRMLTNFGNPEDKEWGNYTSVAPWVPWQINQAMKDLSSATPAEYTIGSFWIWG